jgi:hypothetical protein
LGPETITSAAIGLRRSPLGFRDLGGAVDVVLVLRGAMVPGPGEWRMRLIRSFQDNPRIWVGVESVAFDTPADGPIEGHSPPRPAVGAGDTVEGDTGRE